MHTLGEAKVKRFFRHRFVSLTTAAMAIAFGAVVFAPAQSESVDAHSSTPALAHAEGVTHDKVMVALELPEPDRLRRILPCRQS